MSLIKYVNSSGFPLQLALANLVKNTDGWSVLYEEHNWIHDEDNGFIDIVIEDTSKTWLMNIECKRVKDTKWIFLRDKSKVHRRRYTKVWVSSKKANEDSFIFFGWLDIVMEPNIPQSSYCVVPGQDAKARPMLERIAAIVVKSTEALAKQETETLSNRYSDLRIYQNVIITTAELYLCDTDVEKINITAGEIDESSEFTMVPYLRFRKQVGAEVTISNPANDINELEKITTNKESTVFIVNSAHLGEFLEECEMPEDLRDFIL
ncbi:MAG: hypothetical protein HKM93_08955 [Desulfobacteraceae bacterium]|nr:hypothetical protein [Desulfobacteraceae bacterium]